jgi:hypothetical protein
VNLSNEAIPLASALVNDGNDNASRCSITQFVLQQKVQLASFRSMAVEKIVPGVDGIVLEVVQTDHFVPDIVRIVLVVQAGCP